MNVIEAIRHFFTGTQHVWYVPHVGGAARSEFSSEDAARSFLREQGIDPIRIVVRDVEVP